jgi:hypothetical protein
VGEKEMEQFHHVTEDIYALKRNLVVMVVVIVAVVMVVVVVLGKENLLQNILCHSWYKSSTKIEFFHLHLHLMFAMAIIHLDTK